MWVKASDRLLQQVSKKQSTTIMSPSENYRQSVNHFKSSVTEGCRADGASGWWNGEMECTTAVEHKWSVVHIKRDSQIDILYVDCAMLCSVAACCKPGQTNSDSSVTAQTSEQQEWTLWWTRHQIHLLEWTETLPMSDLLQYGNRKGLVSS